MRVFVTGAAGFIGSHLVPELIAAGHTVLGLARNDANAKKLKELGAEVHRGDLTDVKSLQGGADKADAVVHLAFIHDFSKFAESCAIDKAAIEAMGEALLGSDRPFLITSGTGMGNPAPGQLATEDHANFSHPNPRVASEMAGAALSERGVNVSVVRLPQVHDTARQGLITPAIQVAREKGASAYIGEGRNRWPAAHVTDVAHLYRLALEKHEAGSRYHAVAEEGVTMREIAEVIGRRLHLPAVSLSPEEAQAHFGWLAMFAGFDMPASSALTRQRLGWKPTGPGLLADLEQLT